MVGLPVLFSYLSFGNGVKGHPIGATAVNLGCSRAARASVGDSPGGGRLPVGSGFASAALEKKKRKLTAKTQPEPIGRFPDPSFFS